MSKSRLTLIIDGNWLLMSRMSVLNPRYSDPDKLCNDLKSLMIKSINVVLHQFPLIDNIVFVSDGGSWRNDVEIPQCLVKDNVEYKGQRVPDPLIDWDKIWGAYDDFIAKLKQSGITAVKEQGIEGDDWCWYWSTKLFNEGTNVMIWSRDKDLTQLVKTDENCKFVVCWSKESGTICEDVIEDDMNFLFNPQYSENEILLRSIQDKSKIITKIKPSTVVIDKIIRGDAGDNIKPILTRKPKSETSDKQYKISSKDINFDIDINNDADVYGYITNILESKSYKGRVDKPISDIVEHFKYNKKLISLDRSSYPENVLEKMEKYTDYNCCKNIREAEYQITADANNISSIADFI